MEGVLARWLIGGGWYEPRERPASPDAEGGVVRVECVCLSLDEHVLFLLAPGDVFLSWQGGELTGLTRGEDGGQPSPISVHTNYNNPWFSEATTFSPITVCYNQLVKQQLIKQVLSHNEFTKNMSSLRKTLPFAFASTLLRHFELNHIKNTKKEKKNLVSFSHKQI